MPHKKGHTNNPHGRPPGIPNKATSDLRQFVRTILEENKNLFRSDLRKVSPEVRLAIYERLLQYVLPKQQHQLVTIQEQVSVEYIELERLLLAAPDQAVIKISEKVLQLQKLAEDAKIEEKRKEEIDSEPIEEGW